MTKPQPYRPCNTCGALFLKPHKHSLYCSVQCATEPRIRRAASGCWEWTGAKMGKGYGHLSWDNRVRRTHCLMYETHVGPIPPGAVIMHTCDNRICCNPDHLRAGTQAQNLLDMATKERQANRKLTTEEVRQIRALRPTMMLRELAEKFDVPRSAIENVVYRKAWKHVE